MSNEDEIILTLKELFGYLDIVEETDNGKEFHPVQISCCRAAMLEDASRCIAKLRGFIK